MTRPVDDAIGLYFHIPFCKSKCRYCDFNSADNSDQLFEPYFEALCEEIYSFSFSGKYTKADTIFIGGGTPSHVENSHIYKLINACRSKWELVQGYEATIESNPGTLSYEKLMGYRAMGLNRLSLGLQAWQPYHLASLGRIHSAEEFLESFKLARKAGFRNINVDIMFGLPHQSINEWSTTLNKVADLKPEHISCYSLKYEEGTPFYDIYIKEGIIDTDDALDRDMYWRAVDKLTSLGYKHYEISNFALPGYECRHNMKYWKASEYAGFGAGAHSFLDGARFNNIPDINNYIDAALKHGNTIEAKYEISVDEKISEFIILGLRLIDGISEEEFLLKFGISLTDVYPKQLKKLIGRQLLVSENGFLKLTPYGLDISNDVLSEFI